MRMLRTQNPHFCSGLWQETCQNLISLRSNEYSLWEDKGEVVSQVISFTCRVSFCGATKARFRLFVLNLENTWLYVAGVKRVKREPLLLNVPIEVWEPYACVTFVLIIGRKFKSSSCEDWKDLCPVEFFIQLQSNRREEAARYSAKYSWARNRLSFSESHVSDLAEGFRVGATLISTELCLCRPQWSDEDWRALVPPWVLKLQTGPGHLGWAMEEATITSVSARQASMWQSHWAAGGVGTAVKGERTRPEKHRGVYGQTLWKGLLGQKTANE